MKIPNHLLVAAAAALTVNVALAAQAGEPDSIASSTKNTALLASPRYLEEHPELLRTAAKSEPSPVRKADRLTRNSALANSPRFREEHPGPLWAKSSAEQGTTVSERDRLVKLTENKALANSPRFREEHPELLRGGPEFEIAPLK